MKRTSLHLLAIACSLAIATTSNAGEAQRIAISGGSSALTREADVDQLIVQFAPGSTAFNDPQVAASVLQNALAQTAASSSSRYSDPGSTRAPLTAAVDHRLATDADVVVLSEPVSAAQANAIVQALQANAAVEYAETDRIATASLIPNDTMFSQQWSLHDFAAGIHAPFAWDRTLGNGTTVAVIDTGIVSHPDLDANVLPGYDFISKKETAGDGDKRDKTPRDEGDFCALTGKNSSWHGTHVAGIIAAIANNAQGIAGVAPGANIVPVRALGRCGGRDSDLVDAIVWAAGDTVKHVPANENPAQVINMSLGGGGACSKSMQKAIDKAVARHALLVVSAGNENANAANYWPANCKHVMTVAASDDNGNRADFSNDGTTIDITAPGTHIMSTVDAGLTYSTGPAYANKSGTSMAAPIVSGVAALLHGLAPANCHNRLQPDEIQKILKDTATHFVGNCPNGCGAGIVNAGAAVNEGFHVLTSPKATINWYITDYTVTVDPYVSGCALDSDPIAHAVIDFGDGVSSSMLSTSHTYAQAGTYTITITVTTQSGNVVMNSESVYVSGHDST